MKKFAILLLLCPLLVTPAWAQTSDITNDSDSLLLRGIHLYKQRKYEAAVKILKPFAQEGDLTAIAFMAEAYESGSGIKKDFAKAFELYLSAAKEGDISSQTRLAEFILELGRDFFWDPTIYSPPRPYKRRVNSYELRSYTEYHPQSRLGRIVTLFYKEIGDDGARLWKELVQPHFNEYRDSKYANIRGFSLPKEENAEENRVMAHALAEEWKNGRLKTWVIETLVVERDRKSDQRELPQFGCAKYLDKKGRRLVVLELLKPFSEKANPDAQVSLGCAYQLGYIFNQDVVRGIEIHLTAAKNGDKRAQSRLAEEFLTMGGDFSRLGYREKSYMKKLVWGREPDTYYYWGNYTTSAYNPKGAHNIYVNFWLELAANGGHFWSRFRLYFRGFKIPKQEQAIAHTIAQEWLLGHFKGWAVDAIKDALHYPLFVTPAWAQNSGAIENNESPLARGKDLFYRGEYKAALEILKPLAEDGDLEAQTIMAEAYEFGFGIEQDIPRAIELYLNIAKKGDKAAQTRLVEFFLAMGGDISRLFDMSNPELFFLSFKVNTISAWASPLSFPKEANNIQINFWLERAANRGHFWSRVRLFFRQYTIPKPEQVIAHTIAQEWINGDLITWASEAIKEARKRR